MAPREGHLKRLQRIYGYLRKFHSAAICVNTEKPNISHLPNIEHDWSYSVHSNVCEMLPKDLPPVLGQCVILTQYVDANLYHDLIIGRAVTGISHFIYQTPVEWFSTKQAILETTTYGSEFVAARISVNQPNY
jgi:hypothetical protein